MSMEHMHTCTHAERMQQRHKILLHAGHTLMHEDSIKNTVLGQHSDDTHALPTLLKMGL